MCLEVSFTGYKGIVAQKLGNNRGAEIQGYMIQYVCEEIAGDDTWCRFHYVMSFIIQALIPTQITVVYYL